MDLRVFLKLDGSGFTQGLRGARQAVNRFGDQTFGGLKSQIAAAFTAGAVLQLSRKTIDFAGHMRDLSDRLGVNVEWLQRMNNAAGQAGASMDDLANFMGKVGESRQAAFANPNGPQAQAFGRMGISRGDIAGLNQQDFFGRITKAFANGASLQLENDVVEIGGKSAKKLLAAFSQGLEASGPVMPEGLIDELDNLGDAMFLLNQELMVNVAPGIKGFIRIINSFVSEFGKAFRFLGALSIGFGTHFSINEAWRAAQDAVVEADVDEQTRNDAAAIALRQRRANRRTRELSPPMFDAAQVKNDPAFKAAVSKSSSPSDSLVSVGNFLGASRSTMESIATETNRILKEQLRVLTTISQKRGTDNPLGIPL